MLHVLRMSPSLSGVFDMSWDTTDGCQGAGYQVRGEYLTVCRRIRI
jgi:hypothetical protein